MSEFEKLMAGGSKRPVVKQKIKDKANAWRNWRWSLLIAFGLMLIPPHIGWLFIFPVLIWGLIFALTEWLG